MKLTFLGTGTSVGIPMIGCACGVCRSRDPRNRRRRTSLYVVAAGRHLIVDTPPDFREQMLQFGVPRVDAVLFTHAHADHVLGFDDIRRFNTLQGGVIPAFGLPKTIADLKRIFDYVSAEAPPAGMFRPQIDFCGVEGPFRIGDVEVEPLPVVHDPKPTIGYLFRAEGRTVGFVPDCHALPASTLDRLRGVDVMILDALRHRPHPTHLTVEQSVAVLGRIGARQSYLIHMCHDIDHEVVSQALPKGIALSYDGLEVDLGPGRLEPGSEKPIS